MKKPLLLLALFCVSIISKSQVFQSAFKGAELINLHAFVDSQGNIILTGNEPSVSPGGDSMVYNIIKYSPQGNEIWRRLVSSPLQMYLNPTLLNDQVYVVGSFQQRLHFAGTTSVSAGDYDFCYLKIDVMGNMSMKTEGSTGRELFLGLSTLNNQLYAVGSTSGQVQINNTTITTTVQAAFMEKLDGNFNAAWIKWGYSNNNSPSLGSLKISGANLYAYGAANMTWNQGPTIGTYNYNLIKFDSSGNYIKDFPDIFGAMYHSSALNAEGLNSEVYHMNCYWGPSSYTSEFIAMNSNDTEKWRMATGKLTCSDYSLLIKDNKFYWYDQAIKIADLQTGQQLSNMPLPANNIREAYMAEYPGDQILFYGSFYNSLTLGNTTLQSSTKANAFVSLLNKNILLSTKEFSRSTLNFYPNPVKDVLQLQGDSFIEGAEIKIFTMHGEELLNFLSNDVHSMDLSQLSSGMYLLLVKSSQGTQVQKLIKE